MSPNDGAPAALPTQSMGLLGRLPPEIRNAIYGQLLVAPSSAPATWGEGSGIRTAILSTSREVYQDAAWHLYESPHKIRCFAYFVRAIPPRAAIIRMKRLTVELNYYTINRADCELRVDQSCFKLLCGLSDFVGMTLRQNDVLQELYVCLLNSNQRKRGPRPLRSPIMLGDIKRLLLPYAVLRPSIPLIEITGFDTLEFAEMFDGMRKEMAGGEIPIDGMVNLNEFDDLCNTKPL